MATLRHCPAIFLLLAAAAPAAAQEFGSAAAVAGRDVLIGQASNLYAPGYVYVFRPNAQGAYTVAARLASPDSARNTGFGRRIVQAASGPEYDLSAAEIDGACQGSRSFFRRVRL